MAQLFQLPLVHHEIIPAEDPLHERLDRIVLREQPLELGTANPFGHACGQDDRSAFLHDRQGAGQALDGLIEGGVERVPGAAGDDDIDRLRHRGADNIADEFDARQKGLLHITGDELQRTSLGIDHER